MPSVERHTLSAIRIFRGVNFVLLPMVLICILYLSIWLLVALNSYIAQRINSLSFGFCRSNLGIFVPFSHGWLVRPVNDKFSNPYCDFHSYYEEHVNARTASSNAKSLIKRIRQNIQCENTFGASLSPVSENLCVIYCMLHDCSTMFFFVVMQCFACISQFLAVFCRLMTEPFKFRPLQINIYLFFRKATDFRAVYLKFEATDIIQLWPFYKKRTYLFTIWHIGFHKADWKSIFKRIFKAINIFMFVSIAIIIRIRKGIHCGNLLSQFFFFLCQIFITVDYLRWIFSRPFLPFINETIFRLHSFTTVIFTIGQYDQWPFRLVKWMTRISISKWHFIKRNIIIGLV